MNRYEKIKSLSKEQMANFLKKATCPQYDLLSGDVCCTCCNLEIQCEEEWDKMIPDYIEWLEEEDDSDNEE